MVATECDYKVMRVKHQLMGAAKDAYPDEACGIITFSGQVWSARNMETQTAWGEGMKIRQDYVMDPQDVVVLWPHAAALWHSHPNGRLDPSSVDMHWHPEFGATAQLLGLVIVTCDDVRVAVPW